MLTVHADVVGSLLRPPELLNAREELASDRLSQECFKEIEDRAIDEAIALQEKAGLEVVTDGEMRRESFQSQLASAVSGLGDFTLDAFLWGDWRDEAGVERKPRPEGLGATGRLVRRRSLSADEFAYLKDKTTRIPKITLPSPGLWVNFWSREHSGKAYPTLDAFFSDIVAILREEVAELASLGATYIQLDAPHYGLLLDTKTRGFYEGQGWSVEKWLSAGIDLDNAVMAGFPDVTFGFHI